MWKIVEIVTYFVTIGLCIYQFSFAVPFVSNQMQKVGTQVFSQGINVTDSQDINKVLELGPWGVVFILSVKLVVDYFNKAKEQERCGAKIKEMDDHLSSLLKEMKDQIEKGISEEYDSSKDMESRLGKELTEMRATMARLEQQIAHVGTRNEEMYNWHNANDESGGKIWYVKRSMYDSLKEITDMQRNQADTQKQQASTLEKFANVLERLSNSGKI